MIKHTTLARNPEFFDQVVHLCESSFQYNKHQSFATDFAPLMTERNHEHNHVFIDEHNKLVGHIGVKIQKIQFGTSSCKEEFVFALLGGICVSKNYRGKGFLTQMLQQVLDLYHSTTTMFMLWSDLSQLYEKFSFFEAGVVYQYGRTSEEQHPFDLKKLKDFSESEFKLIQELHQQNKDQCVRFLRDSHDWNQIKEIESAQWWLDTNTKEYFVVNKGKDLEGVIHEHYISSPTTLALVTQYFTLWSAKKLSAPNESSIYLGFFKCANMQKCQDFFNRLAKHSFDITYQEKNLFHLKHDKENFQLSAKEFLRGLWGPDFLSELSHNVEPFFISGLESV